MATKDKDKRQAASGGGAAARFLRYCIVLVLLGAAALAWMSLLSYSPTDPPSQILLPPKDPVDNAAGIVGAHTAHALLYWLGAGAYMGLLFTTVAAFLLAMGGRVGDLPWRIIGVGLLVTATSSAVYMWNPVIAGDPLVGSAGILGIATGQLLLQRFSSVGGWIILLVSFGIGLMLTADRLVLKLPALGRKAWRRSGELVALAGSLRPAAKSPSLPPKVALTSVPRPKAAAPEPANTAPRAAPPVAPGGKDAPPAAKRPIPVPPPAAAGGEEPNESKSASQAAKGDLPAVRLPPPVPPKAAERPAPDAIPRDGDKADKPAKANGGRKRYSLPSTALLEPAQRGYIESQENIAQQRRVILQQTLDDFGVSAQVVGHMTGPVITLFELALAPGVKVAQVSNLCTDVARALAVPGVRVVSPLPGRDTIGIEVPNIDKEIVRIRQLMDLAPDADKKMAIPLYLGKDVGGEPIVADLTRMPHMLIAGTTGSGKSVCINAIIMAILLTRRPEDVRLLLVDPKMVEMAAFEDIPHLLCPIVNDMRRAEEILEWAATKMDERYEILKEAGVKNVAQFNRLTPEEVYQRFGADTDEDKLGVPTRLPYYIIIVDELADLIMTSNKEVENHIIRIAQKARAVGIHLILATQRPSVNVVTGLIKSNMPCRISFRVASRQESRIVLDQNGAEVLLGQGDMLFLRPGTSTLIRAQGTFIEDSEIRVVVKELAGNCRPEYNPELMQLSARPAGDLDNGEKDELFDKAVEIVLASQRGSVSLLQRRLAVGYSRASRIIDQMAEAGILGDYKGSQARECMMTLEDWQALQASIGADQSGASALDGEPTSV